MLAPNSNLTAHRNVAETMLVPVPSPGGVARRRGAKSILLVTLTVFVAVAAWFFFMNLFARGSSIAPTVRNEGPAPASAAESAEPIGAPAAAPQPADIPPPIVETGTGSDQIELAPDLAAERQPVTAQAKGVPAKSATATAKSIGAPATHDERSAAAQDVTTRSPRREPAVALEQPDPSPRAPIPATSPRDRAVPALDPGNTPPLDVATELRQSRADFERTSETIDTPDTARPSTMKPREDSPGIALAAPPETPAKQSARRNYGLVVIVNKANSRPLSRTDISNIYRDRVTRWPSGERILVLSLPLDSQERARFSSAILDMSSMDVETERSNRAITNRPRNEHRTKNAQAIVSHIERDENAIGYIPGSALDEYANVRVVFSVP